MLRRTRTGLITKFNLLTISLIVISSLGIASFLIYQNKTYTYAELLRRGVTSAAMVAKSVDAMVATEATIRLLMIEFCIASLENALTYHLVLNSVHTWAMRLSLNEKPIRTAIGPYK